MVPCLTTTPAPGPGSFVGTGTFDLTGSGSSPGISSSQTLTLNESTADVETSFQVAGIIDVAAATGQAWLDVGGGLTLTVDSGGQINTSGTTGSIAYLGSGGGTIVNNGIINADAVITDLYDGVAFTNDGNLIVPDTTNLRNTGSFTQNASGGDSL